MVRNHVNFSILLIIIQLALIGHVEVLNLLLLISDPRGVIVVVIGVYCPCIVVGVESLNRVVMLRKEVKALVNHIAIIADLLIAFLSGHPNKF